MIDPDALAELAAHAEAADRRPDWPAESWGRVRAAGVLGWSIPAEYGGTARGPVALLEGHEALAAACTTTAFVLSQREAAVRRLLAGPDALKARFLPALAAGDSFLTVGLSQLTTSRQHGGPALHANPTPGGGYVLDGDIPWVTASDHADALVVGATLADGTQVLVVLPTDRPGVEVGPPMELSALCGSRTAWVKCRMVEVEAALVVAGPAPHVLGTVGGGGLETSCLALGVAAAATADLKREADRRPDLVPAWERFAGAVNAARGRLRERAVGPADPDATLALRAECTRLALKATQAGLVAAKGAGFVAPHPAQRRARQALFFLVWSCPRPVASDVLADLLP